MVVHFLVIVTLLQSELPSIEPIVSKLGPYIIILSLLVYLYSHLHVLCRV